MPRTARQKSATGTYHVLLRGINQQAIFNEKEDYQQFFDMIRGYKTINAFELYAYCLMSNHVHILLKVKKETISQLVKGIAGRYATWYNWKYNRRGHLFQDRFKSEPVEDDAYFLTVLRYIHQNPIKAGIVKQLEEYPYNSFNEYMENRIIVDTEFAFGLVNKNDFYLFNQEEKEDKCLEYDCLGFRITDTEARDIIKKHSGCENIEQFLALEEEKKRRYIKIFKEKGISLRQISRLTGVSFGVVRGI